MTQDLTRSLPPGWSVDGLSAPSFDGVNFYRAMPGLTAQFTVKSTVRHYVTLRYQTVSRQAGYSFYVSQDGAARQLEQIPKGEFHNAYVNLALPAGTSHIQFQVDCAAGQCLPLSLYALNVQTVAQRTGATLPLFGALVLALLLVAGLTVWLRPAGWPPRPS